MTARFVAVMVVTLLAFSWQSFVTQTHLHFAPGTFAAPHAAGDHDGPRLSRNQPPTDLPINCPICHDSALAGHYLSTPPIAFLDQAATIVWRASIVIVHRVRTRRSHDWQSRAPPSRPHL